MKTWLQPRMRNISSSLFITLSKTPVKAGDRFWGGNLSVTAALGFDADMKLRYQVKHISADRREVLLGITAKLTVRKAWRHLKITDQDIRGWVLFDNVVGMIKRSELLSHMKLAASTGGRAYQGSLSQTVRTLCSSTTASR